MISCLTLLASSDVKVSSLKCESQKVAQQQAGSSLYLSSLVCMDFLRAPRNFELNVVGKLLMCSLSEFIAGIANPITLEATKCYFTYNC